MSDIGDVARAVEIIGKIIFGELHPSQQAQIKERYDYHRSRVDEFKNALLQDRYLSCATLWDGVVPVIPVSVSDQERERLEQSVIDTNQCHLTKYEWLGQFCCAESTEFLKEVVGIIKTNEDTSQA